MGLTFEGPAGALNWFNAMTRQNTPAMNNIPIVKNRNPLSIVHFLRSYIAMPLSIKYRQE